MAGDGRRYEGLDGLRGIAAVVVFAYHLPDRRYADLLPLAPLAVDFFFVLSGFVLAHAYERPLREGMSPAGFMLRRYIRLMPFYLVGLGIGLVATPAAPWAAVLALLMLPSRAAGAPHLFPFNVPAWSLFFEMIANALYGLIARWLSNAVLGAILAVGLVAVIWAFTHYQGLDTGVFWSEAPGGLARVIWSFFAGVAVYRLHRALPKVGLPWWACAAALVAMMAQPFELALVLAGFPALVFLAANSAAKGITAKACWVLGGVSYGLYAIHAPILELLPTFFLFSGRNVLLTLLAISALVLLLNRFYDEPLRRRLNRWAFRRRNPVAAAS